MHRGSHCRLRVLELLLNQGCPAVAMKGQSNGQNKKEKHAEERRRPPSRVKTLRVTPNRRRWRHSIFLLDGGLRLETVCFPRELEDTFPLLATFLHKGTSRPTKAHLTGLRCSCASSMPGGARYCKLLTAREPIYNVSRMWFLTLVLWLISAAAFGGSAASSLHLSPSQAVLLTQWYEQLGASDSSETFGDFLVRAALLKWHSPYVASKEADGPELLKVDLAGFDCVSILDSSLAVARCAWLQEPTEACFVRELVATRYRNGVMGKFPSRLHYFEDWLDNNRARYRLDEEIGLLGGVLLRRRFFYMSEHRHQFPPMADPLSRDAIAATEARLSKQTYKVIVRSSIREQQSHLRNGDLVGVITREPGRLISHAGLAVHDKQGRVRLLHASSHHRRVIVTATSIANYILRRPERWGITVARPRLPVPKGAFLIGPSSILIRTGSRHTGLTMESEPAPRSQEPGDQRRGR